MVQNRKTQNNKVRHYSECKRMIKWCIRRSNRATHSKPEIKLDIHHFVYFRENTSVAEYDSEILYSIVYRD